MDNLTTLGAEAGNGKIKVLLLGTSDIAKWVVRVFPAAWQKKSQGNRDFEARIEALVSVPSNETLKKNPPHSTNPEQWRIPARNLKGRHHHRSNNDPP